jgi:c-di-GMP-binding flagellar brake protein YcgR
LNVSKILWNEIKAKYMSLLHFRFKERRSTVRVAITIRLTVRWKAPSGDVYTVKTQSQTVSQGGGLCVLEEPIVVGQAIQLVNENSSEAIEAKVVTVRKARDGKTYVGFEFLENSTNFWRMHFPAPGARPLRRAAQTKVLA